MHKVLNHWETSYLVQEYVLIALFTFPRAKRLIRALSFLLIEWQRSGKDGVLIEGHISLASDIQC